VAHSPTARRGEREWVRFLADAWGAPPSPEGPGDDACLLGEGPWAVSTDTLVEGIDFERSWAPPEALGQKALASNLSDIAAMGADPAGMLLTAGLPRGIDDSWVEALLLGMRDLGEAEGVALLGGDLTETPSALLLSLTVFGHQRTRPLRRDGGSPGHGLWVGGPLGGARAALRAFQGGARLGEWDAGGGAEDSLLLRFYRPPSQTLLGLELSGGELASSCIDISDGLNADLHRLCDASGCGAELWADSIPLETVTYGDRSVSLDDALIGGEDQVLLFSVPLDR